MRYRLLETVRQYALEKLGESGEADMVRERHARYYLTLAEEAESELMGAQQEAWLGRLEVEHDNLRAVLARALENGEFDLGLKVAGSLGGFWLVRGRLSEGRRWLEAALEGRIGASDSARARALLRAGLIAREQGDQERSVELLGEALALARKLGDKTTAASALLNLGWAALLRDELQRASELTQESLTLQRETNDYVGVARALTVLGLLANARGDHERAMALHEESLGLAREVQEASGIVLSLMLGALASLGQGNHRRAGELCEEGLESSWRLKMVHPTASHLQIAASVAGSQGQPVLSARLWGAAEASLASVGLELAPLERRFYEPYIAAARSRIGAVAFEAAWAEGRKMTIDEAVQYTLESSDAPEGVEASLAYPAGLSAREAEVLRLVAQGMTNSLVAQRLYLSPRTVGGHLRSVYRKLGVTSRAAAAREALERGLI
jgi:DNA-binding CsgD family transcriptional regulator/tetratricopeptide (TPR) repeat protein